MRYVFIFMLFVTCAYADEIPYPFIDVRDVIPDVVLDIRYYGNHNFVGAPIRGNNSPKCYLSRHAANALKAYRMI